MRRRITEITQWKQSYQLDITLCAAYGWRSWAVFRFRRLCGARKNALFLPQADLQLFLEILQSLFPSLFSMTVTASAQSPHEDRTQGHIVTTDFLTIDRTVKIQSHKKNTRHEKKKDSTVLQKKIHIFYCTFLLFYIWVLKIILSV